MKTFNINDIQLKIQSPDVTLDDELKSYLHLQIEKLGKTFGRIERCEMMLRVVKNSENKKSEVEAKLFVPSHLLFAVHHEFNFRLAAKLVFDDLQRQLSKFKDKITDKTI